MKYMFIILLLLSACSRPPKPAGGLTEPGLQDAVKPVNLERAVRFLAGIQPPRNYLHPESLDRVAEFIAGEFEAAGGAVGFQEFSIKGRTYQNVCALFGSPGSSRIIVGAHYDVSGPHPGADDNASAVAGLIALAHLLNPDSLGCSVELVAYTLEETPFFRSKDMGSARHAEMIKRDGVDLRAMISLEMIGFFSDEPGSQEFPSPEMAAVYPVKGNFISVVGRTGEDALVNKVHEAMASATDLPVEKLIAPQDLTVVELSDHRSYWAKGFPAVMVTDTAFYRNKKYHTAADTPDKLDYRRMSKVIRGLNAAVTALSLL